MASKRKKFNKKNATPDEDPFLYADFMAQVLSGAIVATQLYDTARRGNGKLDLEYEDPNG